MERRDFFKRTGAVAALGLFGQLIPGASNALGNVLHEVSGIDPIQVAKDEAFWRKIRAFYTPPIDFLDLDHANTSPTSAPVSDAFLKRSKRLSQAPAERLGEMWGETGKEIRTKSGKASGYARRAFRTHIERDGCAQHGPSRISVEEW